MILYTFTNKHSDMSDLRPYPRLRHAALLLFKILILVNLLACLNTEYRSVIFWAVASAPSVLYFNIYLQTRAFLSREFKNTQ
ncbi:hypothetical protein [uncultured Campylobacter sp.]|uniref:hypothetical protein n=1 Tax=uncultured Campylobacter sp. TaxID=218934 RepID=UPI0026105850|nr:hypothetical protein [uncultured Campylobacter sp.]